MEDAGVDVDHAPRRHFEGHLLQFAPGFGVKLSCQQTLGSDLGRGGNQVTARNHLEAAVATGETVEIVENLDVAPVPFGEVHRMVVLPVVVVLVIGERTDATRCQVEGRMAEVILGGEGGLQQRGDEGIVDQLVAARAPLVPGADEIGPRLIRHPVKAVEVLPHRIEAENLCRQLLARFVLEDVGIQDVAVTMVGIDVPVGGGQLTEQRAHGC